ncbi:MAG TPA: carboxypeptidase-like regulatory domain-containing protein, partial [Burkholderiales bacterium]|nr:carboxypeptidase-like regulatory domain-containing protein [Burkholderiales bacterium]
MVPSGAYAQASVTGVVRDTSGAVLPGVTVEAASPALIEKVRSVITDGSGQYRVEDLRPGAYTVTFTLPGFSTVKREGIQLTGNFAATINVELRVGALEETITVTGETPTVDVQNTIKQRVLDAEILEALPATRSIPFVAALTAGVTTANVDVGGLRGMGPSGAGPGSIFVHGVDDPRLVINGNSVHSIGTGSGNQGAANMAAYVEILVDTAGIGAEQKEGGLRMQLIPKDGGNTYSGYFLGAWANHSWASSNYNDDLKNRGLPTPNALKRIWDVNPAFGGPIKQDKLWFHVTTRWTGAQSYRALFQNKNAGNPNLWTYEPSSEREEVSNVWRNINFRVTWQATPRNK